MDGELTDLSGLSAEQIADNGLRQMGDYVAYAADALKMIIGQAWSVRSHAVEVGMPENVADMAGTWFLQKMVQMFLEDQGVPDGSS